MKQLNKKKRQYNKLKKHGEKNTTHKYHVTGINLKQINTGSLEEFDYWVKNNPMKF